MKKERAARQDTDKRQKTWKNRLAGLFASTALCAVLIFLSGCGPSASGIGNTAVSASAPETASSGQESTQPDSVTVSARASSYAVPDRAELRFGVRTQAETASEAQKENTAKVDAVISTMKKSGLKEEDIQTSWYDVSPQYDWNTGNGDTIVGYSVSSTLTVKNVKIDSAGALITSCTEAGANEFNGISYSCSEYDRHYGEALKKAVNSSKEKALLLAEAAGRSLGEITSISEGFPDMTYAANTKSLSMMEADAVTAGEAAGTALLPGEAEITASVTVTYTLK